MTAANDGPIYDDDIDLDQTIAEMWEEIEKDDALICDSEGVKIGLPFANPYEGVQLPICVHGETYILGIDGRLIERFSRELLIQKAWHLKEEKKLEKEYQEHCKREGIEP